MAKTDLLKEAIADAKAVKETAIANAKIALEEAFGNRLQSMLGKQLQEAMEDEEVEMEPGMDDMEKEPGTEDMEMEPGMDDMADMNMPDSIGVGIDIDSDGTYDYEGDLPYADSDEEEMAMTDDEMAMTDDEMTDELGDEELDAELSEIIAELEEGAYDMAEADMYEEEDMDMMENMAQDLPLDNLNLESKEMYSEDIDAIIAEILAEGEECPECGSADCKCGSKNEAKNSETEKELKEAYSVIKQLRYTINEVNLLNAKLLYTNKLFRNFELNESQKMKVIENFDRAASTREVKLVFSTLSESFKKPVNKKKVVKESKSYASKPTTSTAPKQEIISESAAFANRWKKLAGLI